jgi:MFS family permease
MALISVVLFTLVGNASILMPAPYIGPWSVQYDVTPQTASTVESYPALIYALINLIWVPFALKFGRRPTWLTSIVIFTIFQGLCSIAGDFQTLFAFNILASAGAGICETVAVMLVDDIFFLHERGAILTFYTAALCLAAIAPLPAGYMLPNWHQAYWTTACAGAGIFVLGFFFVQETYYDREEALKKYSVEAVTTGKIEGEHVEITEAVLPPRKPYSRRLKPWSGINHRAQFWVSAIRQFSFLGYPAVMWTIIYYGIAIGIGALFISFSFPSVIEAPPYNRSDQAGGTIALAGFIGTLLSLPIGPLSDRWAAYMTRKHGGRREPEYRLWCLVPALIMSPCGLILYALSAYYKLHWFGMFFGVALYQSSNFHGFSILIAYMVDCYNRNTAELLGIFIACKGTLLFGMGFEVLTWIEQRGIAVIGSIFAAVMLFIYLWIFFFIYFGKDIRRWTANGEFHISTRDKYCTFRE